VTDAETVKKILYTPTEAANALGISRSTIYLLIASGDVPSVRIGSCRRLPVDGLRRYVTKLAEERSEAQPSKQAGQPHLRELT
jgi:excisionase family DNA binding protein